MLKVKIFTINKGEPSERFFLGGFDKDNECRPLHYAPYWKTKAGARRWAERNGYEVVGEED